jgi:hypothetical protein
MQRLCDMWQYIRNTYHRVRIAQVRLGVMFTTYAVVLFAGTSVVVPRLYGDTCALAGCIYATMSVAALVLQPWYSRTALLSL